MNDLARLARGVIAAGFEGERFDSSLPEFGAYVIFARNAGSFEGLHALTAALRDRTALDGLAPAIAIDQEGGRVVRLRDGVEAMPPAMAMGAAGDAELVRRAGEQTGWDVRRAGCTLDFAPVLDLASHAANTVIGTRSFGSDPHAVARLGAAFGAGLEAGGVTACYKHFPGHGATATDSHLALPAIDDDERTLRARDLVPFAAVARTAKAFMATHALVRAFDPDLPATRSPAVATRLLRDELEFTGALATDCLQMAALAGTGLERAGVDALAAGFDLLVVSREPGAALALAGAIEAAVLDGRLPRERLARANARVRALRVPSRTLPGDVAPHPGVGREIARRAVTLVRGVPHIDPTSAIAVSFSGALREGIETDPRDQSGLRRESPALEEVALPLDPSDADVAQALRALDESRRRPLLLARRAHLHPRQAGAIGRVLADYPDAVAVSLLEPYDVPLFPSARHVLAAYGDDPASVAGLADVLFGGSPPEGRLPVVLA